MKKNMRTWMSDIVNSPDRKAMPIVSYPGADIKGINIVRVVSEANAQYECIKAISDKFPAIANVTCMDLSVEAQAFGCEVKFSENEVPKVARGMIRDITDIEKLEVPQIGVGRTGAYIEAAALSATNIIEKPTFAGMIGPFSLAGRLFDMTEIMLAIIMEPEMIHGLLRKCVLFLEEYAKALKATGANGLIIAEPAAGLLSPEQCHTFSSEYVKKIIDAVQDDYFMVVLHNCGNTENLVESMVSTGAMGLHFGNTVDMTNILPQIPLGKVVMGNVDPSGVLKRGTPEEIMEKTGDLLRKTVGYRNFILSTGCDVPPGTPQDNIQAFYHELERFNHSAKTE